MKYMHTYERYLRSCTWERHVVDTPTHTLSLMIRYYGTYTLCTYLHHTPLCSAFDSGSITVVMMKTADTRTTANRHVRSLTLLVNNCFFISLVLLLKTRPVRIGSIKKISGTRARPESRSQVVLTYDTYIVADVRTTRVILTGRTYTCTYNNILIRHHRRESAETFSMLTP